MVVMDPIGDLLVRLKNAGMVGHDYCRIPASRFKAQVLAVLKEEGFLKGFRFERQGTRVFIVVELKYSADGKPVLRGAKRISKPGVRVYSAKASRLRYQSARSSVRLLSTPIGVLSASRADKSGHGGEVLCEVW